MKVDLHPEELLERERFGLLGDDERLRLDQHAKSCAACAFERRAPADFTELFEPFAGDEALLATLVDRAMNAPRASRRSLHRISLAPRAPRRFTKLLLIAAAALVGGAALAAAYTVVSSRFRKAEPPPPSAASAPEVAKAASGLAPAPSAAVPAVAPAPSAEPAPSASPSAASSSRPGEADTGLDAAGLFAAGNKARRSGAYGNALRLYGELQRRFPGSREAHTSQLALGWLMLNQLGNASGALAQFNGYLAGGGVMSEEALAGRALALQRLGRSAEERKAWQDLITRYPDSINAERARKRLGALK
jgi:TolA-binding protein